MILPSAALLQTVPSFSKIYHWPHTTPPRDRPSANSGNMHTVISFHEDPSRSPSTNSSSKESAHVAFLKRCCQYPTRPMSIRFVDILHDLLIRPACEGSKSQNIAKDVLPFRRSCNSKHQNVATRFH